MKRFRKPNFNRDYNDAIYKQWRRDVRKRDRYKCRWMACNKRSRLQVHHIMTWAGYPLLRYTVANGITLCKEHHDFIKGREEDYQEFLFKCLSSQ